MKKEKWKWMLSSSNNCTLYNSSKLFNSKWVNIKRKLKGNKKRTRMMAKMLKMMVKMAMTGKTKMVMMKKIRSQRLLMSLEPTWKWTTLTTKNKMKMRKISNSTNKSILTVRESNK